MVAEAEIRVLDVKCHISAAKDQKNFQIDEVRVSESVRAEISGSAETPRFGSVCVLNLKSLIFIYWVSKFDLLLYCSILIIDVDSSSS